MNETLANLLLGPSRGLAERFWAGLSKLMGALVIFLVGWLLAKFVKRLITQFFKTIRVDKLAHESGVNELLEKGSIRKEVSDLLGIAVYWLVMLVVLFMAVNFAGVQIPESVIDQLLSFIPNFILGLLIFVLALFMADLFSGIVRASAANAGLSKARALGDITRIAIVVFGLVAALQHLGVAGAFIGNVFIIVLAAFCFGCALAFAVAVGLGAQHIAREYLEGMLRKKPEERKSGEAGESGSETK